MSGDAWDSLVKEAYVGAPSRALFPLTEEFARSSNNSTAALRAVGTVYWDTDARPDDAPYYECDGRVRFEVCFPILRAGEVIGLLDLEAWRPHHLTRDGVAFIALACQRLASHLDEGCV